MRSPAPAASVLGKHKRKNYLEPLGSRKQRQVRNSVQVTAAPASTSLMHKHVPSDQTFLCSTIHASPACQPRGKTNQRVHQATRLQSGIFGQPVLSAYTVGREKEALPMFPAHLVSCLGRLLSLECAGERLIVRKQHPLGCLEQSTMGGFVPKLILTHNLA